MSSAPADACKAKGADVSRLEYYLFEQADKAVARALNEASSAPSSKSPVPGPREQAVRALGELEQLSAGINKEWPEGNRFHFEVLDVPPALVVKMTFRNRATLSVFGVPRFSDDRKPNAAWKVIDAADDGRLEPLSGYDSLDLFPLRRGQSHRARFLAKFEAVGCGSGVGVSYYAYEWDPDNPREITEFLKLEGSVSQEDPVDKTHPSKKDLSSFFPPIGKLETTGTRITLPYCWFSQIDTWDNPSLCAVDTYDISQDRARFIGRITNRPDLVPIAKALEYGQAHDYLALLAYCASPKIALKILTSIPPYVYAGDLRVSRTKGGKERIEIGDDDVFQFDVEKRAGRWLVAGFHIE